MMTWYKLPEALGGGEHEAVAEHGDDRAFELVGVRDWLWLHVGDLTEVKPPFPPEPPVGSVVIDNDGDAWQRNPEAAKTQPGTEWVSAMGIDPTSWAYLNETHGPITRLVRYPFAESVALPQQNGIIVVDLDPRGLGGNGLPAVSVQLRSTQHYITADVARKTARALWAAADRAEGVK